MLRPGLLTCLVLLNALTSDARSLGFGPERPVSSPVIEPARAFGSAPRLAANGEVFLAVWRGSDPRVLNAARFSSNGEVLDPISLVIGTNPINDFSFDVSEGPDGFAVAYDCLTPEVRLSVCISTVSLDGEVALLHEVQGEFRSNSKPAIAWNGQQYLLAWLVSRNSNNGRVHARLLDHDGNNVSEEFQLGPSGFQPALTAVGADFALVYETFLQLEVDYVSSDGAVRKELQPRLKGRNVGFDIASDGKDVLIVWGELDGGTFLPNLTLKSRLLPPSGSVQVHAERILVEPSLFPADAALVWNGSNYLLTYTINAPGPDDFPRFERDSSIQSLSLTAGGEPIGSPHSLVEAPGTQWHGAVASNGVDVSIAWAEVVSTKTTIRARVVNRNSDAMTLPRAVVSQRSLAGTSIGDKVILAWTESAGTEQRETVFVGSATGSDQAPDGRGVSVRSSDFDQINPALTPEWIAWIERAPKGDATVVARRLGGDGMPFGETFAVGDAARNSFVSMASIGSNHFFVWETRDRRLVGARVSRHGFVFDRPPIVIGTAAGGKPFAVSNGRHYLVSWLFPYTIAGCSISCQAFAPVAVLLDETGRAVAARQQLADEGFVEAATWNETNFVLLVRRFIGPDPNTRINGSFVRAIDPGGRVISNNVVNVSDEFRSLSRISLSWDATRAEYLFVGVEPKDTFLQDLRAGRLSSTFETLEKTSVRYENGLNAAVLVRPADGPPIVAYSRLVPEFPFNSVLRVFTRAILDRSRRRAVSH